MVPAVCVHSWICANLRVCAFMCVCIGMCVYIHICMCVGGTHLNIHTHVPQSEITFYQFPFLLNLKTPFFEA